MAASRERGERLLHVEKTPLLPSEQRLRGPETQGLLEGQRPWGTRGDKEECVGLIPRHFGYSDGLFQMRTPLKRAGAE